MSQIFLSYRRKDSAAITGRIFDRMVGHFGRQAVIMDIDNIPYGKDFRAHVARTLESCDVILAVIGPGWSGPDAEGQERVARPSDWVRIELEVGLRRRIPIVPLLVEDAVMPEPERLPPSLQDFAYYHAAEVDSGVDFHAHMDRVIRHVEQLLAEGRQHRAATAPATAPSLIADQPPAPAAMAAPPLSQLARDESSSAHSQAPSADIDREKPEVEAAPSASTAVIADDSESSAKAQRARKRRLWWIGSLLLLAVAIAVGVYLRQASRWTERVLVGEYGHWTVTHEVAAGREQCVAYFGDENDDQSIRIQQWGADLTVRLGFAERTEEKATIDVYLDGDKVASYKTYGPAAYLMVNAEEFIAIVERGDVLEIRYKTAAQKAMTQSYDLAGLSAALRQIAAACGVPP